MAAVHGPVAAHHPTSFDKVSKLSRPTSTSQKPTASDPFYGHQESARLCAKFVTHLFTCPEYPTGVLATTAPPATLAHFVAYSLHRTRLPGAVTFAALYLLQRLKQRFPAARGSSGHRLWLSAFMIASKVICDDTYSNKSWCIVGQNMFALREINQMEREMCSYLEWELNVDRDALEQFESLVRKEFSGPGPYQTVHLPTPRKPLSSAIPPSSSMPIDFLPAKRPASADKPSTSPPKPYINPERLYGPVRPRTSPEPDTPDMSRSETPSPASTCSPQTPPSSICDPYPQIAGAPDPLPRTSAPAPANLLAPVVAAPMVVDHHHIPASLKAAQMAKAMPGTGPGKLQQGMPKGVTSKMSLGQLTSDAAYAYARASRW